MAPRFSSNPMARLHRRSASIGRVQDLVSLKSVSDCRLGIIRLLNVDTQIDNRNPARDHLASSANRRT